jgi:hypothetical protein
MTFTPGWYYQPGVKVSARPRPSWLFTPGWYYQPGVKVSPLLPVVNLYSRKRTPGWATGSKGGCQPGVYVIPVLVSPPSTPSTATWDLHRVPNPPRPRFSVRATADTWWVVPIPTPDLFPSNHRAAPGPFMFPICASWANALPICGPNSTQSWSEIILYIEVLLLSFLTIS